MLFLVWARSQKKAFHLPGGDGVAITIAGGWAVLLLVWRMFDRPAVKGVGVDLGIQWGLFVALICAGGLVVAGARVRAAHAPEPPNPVADDGGWVAPPPRGERDRRPERRPRDATAVTEMLRDRPSWEGDARTAGEEPTTRLPDPPRSARAACPIRRTSAPPRSSTTLRAPRPSAARRLAGRAHPPPAPSPPTLLRSGTTTPPRSDVVHEPAFRSPLRPMTGA